MIMNGKHNHPKDHKFQGIQRKINEVNHIELKSLSCRNKQKAHQLSINLRKGSPIKTQVNLFTTESNSNNSVYDNINIGDISKQIKICKSLFKLLYN